MANFDYPNININKKSNEENMQSAKTWMVDMSDKMNLYITNLQERIESLEEKVKDLEGDE